MKSQSHRIKADRKQASTENQESRGVAKEITWEPNADGELIRKEGESFFLRETGEELEELILIGGTELLMSKGGRIFLRGEIEGYFDGKRWRPVGDDGTPTNRRRMGNADMEVTPASAQKKSEIDGSLIRREGGGLFLLETGEELDELASSGPEELLMSKGGRFFLRITHEEYFEGKQWLPESRAAKLKHPRRNVCQDREITHAAAIRWLLDNNIPSQMWGDFSQQPARATGAPFTFIELESSIYKVNAVLFLVSQHLARELEGDRKESPGSDLAAGIMDLCYTTTDTLTQAFNNSIKIRPPASVTAV